MLVGPLTLIANVCAPLPAGATFIAGGAAVVTGTGPPKGWGAAGDGRAGNDEPLEGVGPAWLPAGTKMRTTVLPEPPAPNDAPAGISAPP